MVNTFSVENINAYKIVLGLLKKVVDLLKLVLLLLRIALHSTTILSKSTTILSKPDTILSVDVLDTKSSASAENSISDELS